MKLTPCDATLEFIHDINDPKNEKARMITQCCLFKERHIGQNGRPYKHLSLNVVATVGGEQYEGTEGWSGHLEEIEE